METTYIIGLELLERYSANNDGKQTGVITDIVPCPWYNGNWYGVKWSNGRYSQHTLKDITTNYEVL